MDSPTKATHELSTDSFSTLSPEPVNSSPSPSTAPTKVKRKYKPRAKKQDSSEIDGDTQIPAKRKYKKRVKNQTEFKIENEISVAAEGNSDCEPNPNTDEDKKQIMEEVSSVLVKRRYKKRAKKEVDLKIEDGSPIVVKRKYKPRTPKQLISSNEDSNSQITFASNIPKLTEEEFEQEFQSAKEHFSQQRYSESLKIVHKVLLSLNPVETKDFWKIIKCKSLHSRILDGLQNYPESTKLLKDIWEAVQTKLGPLTKSTLIARINYGDALYNQGLYRESLQHYEEIILGIDKIYMAMMASDQTPILFSRDEISQVFCKKASNLLMLKRNKEAIDIYMKMLKAETLEYGELSPKVLQIKAELATIFLKTEDIEKCKVWSQGLMDDCIRVCKDKPEEDLLPTAEWNDLNRNFSD